MGDLRCHFTTYNCGRSFVHVDYFASSLFTKLQPSHLAPDLIVLSLQEVAPIAHSFLGGAFLAPYFARLEESVTRAAAWRFGNDVKYGNVATGHVGMTAIMVFATQSLVGRIQWVDEAGTGVGVFDMGNKGAVGVRLGLDMEQADAGDGDASGETVVTFVAAHLAPMEAACARRNEDWRRICENLVFQPKAEEPNGFRSGSASPRKANSAEAEPLLSADSQATTAPASADAGDEANGMFATPSARRGGGGHLFFAGDLNYRTADAAPGPADFDRWPQPMAAASDPSHSAALFARDQLSRERAAGRTLHGLAEAPVAFPPTYKYSSRAQKLAADQEKAHLAAAAAVAEGATTKPPTGSTGSSAAAAPAASAPLPLDDVAEQVWLWAKHRVPSWCDRILFLAAAPPAVHAYAALPVQPTSDHRPVTLAFSIPRGPRTGPAVEPPFAIASGWRERRAAARRYELVVGMGAYLSTTATGQAVLASVAVGVALVYYLVSSNV